MNYDNCDHLIKQTCDAVEPVSQRVPVNPGTHVQVKRFIPSTHVPFTHGLDAHSSTSRRNIISYYDLFIRHGS